MELHWKIFHTHQPKRSLSPLTKKLIWDWAYTDPADPCGPAIFLSQAIRNEIELHGLVWTGSVADLLEPNTPKL